jgi:hypothetical protein
MAKERTVIRKGECKVERIHAASGKRGEIWRVSSPEGKTKTITTSKASTRAINETAAKYSRALKRLADR